MCIYIYIYIHTHTSNCLRGHVAVVEDDGEIGGAEGLLARQLAPGSSLLPAFAK